MNNYQGYDNDYMGDGVYDDDDDDDEYLQRPIRLRPPSSVYKIHAHVN